MVQSKLVTLRDTDTNSSTDPHSIRKQLNMVISQNGQIVKTNPQIMPKLQLNISAKFLVVIVIKFGVCTKEKSSILVMLLLLNLWEANW
jgi:hypothetical protein